MAVFFPPDSLLGRYEDLLAEKNSLLAKVSTLEAQLQDSVDTPGGLSLSPREATRAAKPHHAAGGLGATAGSILPCINGLGEQEAKSLPAGKNDPNARRHSSKCGTSSLASGHSGCSSFESCMSTSTSMWDGEAFTMQDGSGIEAIGSKSSSSVNGEKLVPEQGTFVIENDSVGKITRIGATVHKSKGEPLQVVLPTLEAKKSSPCLEGRRSQSYHSPIYRPVSSPRMPLDGAGGARGLACVDPEEIYSKEDVPSRLSSMSAGQINTIITSSDCLLDSLKEADACITKTGKSAGVCDRTRESKQNPVSTAVSDCTCDTPKTLSGAIRKGEVHGRSHDTPSRESMCSPFGRQLEQESSRLSMDDLCKQMMQGIREMRQVSLDVSRRTGISTDESSNLDIDRATTYQALSTTSACLLSTVDDGDVDTSLHPPSFTSPLEQTQTNESPEIDSWKIKSSLLQIRSQTSNLPLPPPSVPSLTVDLCSRRKSDPSGKMDDSPHKHDLAQRQGPVPERHTPSPYDLLRTVPSTMQEAGQHVNSEGLKDEVHRTFENPLGPGGAATNDLANVDKLELGGAALDNGVQRYYSGNNQVLPAKARLPKPASFPSMPDWKQGASLPHKQKHFRNFRNFCDTVYTDAGKSVANDGENMEACEQSACGEKGSGSWVIKGVQSQVSSSQGCLKDMVETVRRKLSGEHLHKILLSPVSEENNGCPLSRKCVKDFSMNKSELSKKKNLELQNCIPFSLSVVKESFKMSFASQSVQSPPAQSDRRFGKTKTTNDVSRKKTVQHVVQESRQSLMDCCFSSTCLGHRVNLSRRGRIAASQTDGARTDFVISQALVSTGTVQFDLHCDRLDGWAFVGIVAANEVDMCCPRGLAECPSSYGWTNDSEFFERGTYHFEALRELISPGANFQINVDCDRGVVSFRLARPSRRGGHQCHKRFLVCELSNLPRHDWRLVIEWLGTARFELVGVKRW